MNKAAPADEVHKVVVITGASSGIGLAAAKSLAAQGWRVIATGRNEERIATSAAQIRSVASGGASVDMIRVELALLSDALRAADEIASLTGRIDVLINNAGGAAREREITAEGNEATFAGNHLGHFVLTHRLLPLLRAAAARSPRGATRIINVASSAHEVAPGFDWDDVQMLNNFAPMPAYCNAKLANMLFTRMLAERLMADGIVVHAAHPGAVDTHFIDRADERTQQHMRSRELRTAEDAAGDIVWLAAAAEPGESSGDYFHRRARIPSSKAANDAAAMQRLWLESVKLTSQALNCAALGDAT